jgi:hypothetical protein
VKRFSNENSDEYRVIRNVDSSAEMSFRRVNDVLMYNRTEDSNSPRIMRYFVGGRIFYC